MIVKLLYETGVEVFDTAERVDPATYAGNALANWAIDLEDAREGDGLPADPQGRRLWLHLYTHEIAQPSDSSPASATPGAQESPRGLPTALRHDAASFLLADERDISRLLQVTVNGEPVLTRIGGELVNAARFAHAVNLASVHVPQAVFARQVLEAALADEIEGDPDVEICRLMGHTPTSFAQVERLQPPSILE